MAQKKYKNKKYKRRFRKRHFRRGYKHKLLNNYGFGLPRRLKTKLKKVGFFEWTTGTLTAYSINLNSLFDPFAWIGATQPMLFNNLESIYKRYRVNAVKIRISFTNKTTTEFVHIVAYTSRTVTAPWNVSAAREQPGAQYRYLASGGNVGDRLNIKKYVSMSRILGPQAYTENSSALMTANPTNIVYGIIVTANDDLTTAIDVGVAIDLTYYCTLYDYHTQNESA